MVWLTGKICIVSVNYDTPIIINYLLAYRFCGYLITNVPAADVSIRDVIIVSRCLAYIGIAVAEEAGKSWEAQA